jgi:hypothetical protein
MLFTSLRVKASTSAKDWSDLPTGLLGLMRLGSGSVGLSVGLEVRSASGLLVAAKTISSYESMSSSSGRLDLVFLALMMVGVKL